MIDGARPGCVCSRAVDRTPWQERIGVGESVAGYGSRTGPTRTTVKVGEEGKLAGVPVGKVIDHKDGRRDAVVQRGEAVLLPALKEAQRA